MTTLHIGSIDLAIVSDGRLRMDPATMFGPDQSAEFRRQVKLDQGRVPLSINCVLLRVGEQRLLLDTGTGRGDASMLERYGSDIGHLPANLAGLGVPLTQIDTVVLSHAHADHVGGACEGGLPTFPNARYWLWQAEWDYWSAPERVAERPYLARSLLPLETRGLLELADSEVEVAPGVCLVASPGHTPGHVCVVLTSGQEMAIYCGDLLHHVCQLDHPEWSPAFDLLPEVSAESRRRILGQALRDQAVLLTAHLPTPGIVTRG
jgi:glyoxylase-like metal-dependent hydrolase (beta-lactamase superfamily II)